MLRKQTKYLVLHCSATPPGMDVGVERIREWHVQGNGWSDIGYHFVIRRDGRVENGRNEASVGSHVAGHNHYSIGICLVGGVDVASAASAPQNNFTEAQWAALRTLLRTLLDKYPQATILGHRDFPGVSKACPSFDARAWATANGFPAATALRGIVATAKDENVQAGTGVGLISGGGVTEAGMQLAQIGTDGWLRYVIIGLVLAGAIITIVGVVRRFWREKPEPIVEGEI